MTAETILLDFDGVLRHFDAAHMASVESRHGLTPGSILASAFEPQLLESALTGRITQAEWLDRIAVALGSPSIAREWFANRGHVDGEMLQLVDELRAAGLTVAILTNGTDSFADELRAFDLVDRFDAVFNSADIGSAKPDQAIFVHACRVLGVPPEGVFFTDDSPRNVAAAIELGITAKPFESVERLRADLRHAR